MMSSGTYSGVQRWLNIHRSVCVIQHINVMKDKKKSYGLDSSWKSTSQYSSPIYDKNSTKQLWKEHTSA